jgi:hypothetical protein
MSRMNFLPSAVAIVFVDSRSSQCKTRHRVTTGVRKRSASTECHPLARKRSFYALLEQFWFAGSRHSHYALCHDSDFVLQNLKLKPD